MSSNGKLILKITGLYRIVEEPVEYKNVNIDYTDTIGLLRLVTCIGVTQSQKPRFFVEAK